MSSLEKLPWIIFVTASIYISFNVPKNKAPAEQKVIVGKDYRFVKFFVQAKNLFLLLAVVESTEILRGYTSPQTETLSLHLAPTSIAGALMTMTGAYIRRRCYAALGRLFTQEVTMHKDHRLVVDGPYGVVRHPGYTALWLGHAGNLLWHLSPGSFLRASPLWVRRILTAGLLAVTVPDFFIVATRIGIEDRLMKERFGTKWDEWAKKVPYKLVPYIY